MQWIKYLSTTEGVHIQHARNGGEKEIGSYKVDGYYESRGYRDAFLKRIDASVSVTRRHLQKQLSKR
jgi:hypothetical protein